MANHDPEFTESVVDEQGRVHDEALRRAAIRNHPLGAEASTIPSTNPSPSDSLRTSEALGVRGTSDATLNWAGGRHVASRGLGDDRPFPDSAAGVSAETITARVPEVLDRGQLPAQRDGLSPSGNALSGVDRIISGGRR